MYNSKGKNRRKGSESQKNDQINLLWGPVWSRADILL